MKANELRIGNYYDNNGEVKKATPNTILEVWESERIWCKEIKLTEEWLINLSFEKLTGWDDMIYFNNNGIHIYLCGNYINDWFEYENDIIIKSIHQLQNLYFAITGKELTINK